MNDAGTHYAGKRINVEVGQLLVVSCFLWHATALPCPIYGRLSDDREHWVTSFDYRLHGYLGCNTIDVDDQNLTLPPGESGMKKTTTYVSPEVRNFAQEQVLQSSKAVFKDKQINQKP
jgi:hypothetical protein